MAEFKIKRLVGTEQRSPLRELMDKLDSLAGKYYPQTISNFKSGMPDFTRKVPINKDKVYRANVPGYFYRNITNTSNISSRKSAIYIHSESERLDSVILGYVGRSLILRGYDKYTTSDWATTINGSSTPHHMAVYLQLRVANNGIPDNSLHYIVNNNSVGTQLVPIVPGIGTSTNSGDYLYMSVEKCTYFTEGNNTYTDKGMLSAEGCYFRYYNDSNGNDSLYFVPAKCSDSGINAITEIRSAMFTESNLRENRVGDILSSKVQVFSKSNRGHVANTKHRYVPVIDKNGIATFYDYTNIYYAGHDNAYCYCFTHCFMNPSITGLKTPFLVADLQTLPDLYDDNSKTKLYDCAVDKECKLYSIMKLGDYTGNFTKFTP